MEAGGETPALYTVFPEKNAAVDGALMGSSHMYDIRTAGALRKVRRVRAVTVYTLCTFIIILDSVYTHIPEGIRGLLASFPEHFFLTELLS